MSESPVAPSYEAEVAAYVDAYAGEVDEDGRRLVVRDGHQHRTTGFNVQVVCDLEGRLVWISDPVDGRRHDSAALTISGVMDGADPNDWMGDKGYVGAGMITPIKKPVHRKLLDWEKEFNKEVNKIRYQIEQVIANFKTWRILHTDYRRPLATFKEAITTVIALHFYKLP